MDVVAVLGEDQHLHRQESHGQVGQHLHDQTICLQQLFSESEKRTYLYALFFKQRKAKYHFKEVSIVEEWAPAGAGGGEHEQRAEGDEEQDQGEQEEIHVLLVALEDDEEQDQGEQEEIHVFFFSFLS